MPVPAWPFPTALAHRGGGALAPENTLAAFDRGWQHGYRAAETDAVLSADDVPVLLHDETLERTTNGHGSVAAHTAAELEQLDAGSWFGSAFAGAPVPRLAQALQHCRVRGIWLNVEIKPVSGYEQRTGMRVAQVVAQLYPVGAAAPLPLLSSFSRQALQAARTAAAHLPRALLVEAIPGDWQRALQALDCVALHCDHRTLTQEQVLQVKSAGYGVLCYTVNDPERARVLRAWGVDAICTDRIDLIAP